MQNRLGDMYFQEGRFGEALDSYEKCTVALQESDPSLASQALSRMAQCFLEQGELIQAEDHLQRSIAIMEGLGDSSDMADALLLLAGIHHRQGLTEEALLCSRQCLKIREQRKDQGGVVAALNYMGLIQTERQDWAVAEECYQRVAVISLENGESLPEAEALSNLGSIQHLQGELETAMDYYGRALEIFDRLGNKQGSSQTQSNLGLIYQKKGDLSLAQDYFQKSIEAKEQLGDDQGVATTKLNLGLVLQIKGEWDLAKSLFEEASLAFEDLGDVRGSRCRAKQPG